MQYNLIPNENRRRDSAWLLLHYTFHAATVCWTALRLCEPRRRSNYVKQMELVEIWIGASVAPRWSHWNDRCAHWHVKQVQLDQREPILAPRKTNTTLALTSKTQKYSINALLRSCFVFWGIAFNHFFVHTAAIHTAGFANNYPNIAVGGEQNSAKICILSFFSADLLTSINHQIQDCCHARWTVKHNYAECKQWKESFI